MDSLDTRSLPREERRRLLHEAVDKAIDGDLAIAVLVGARHHEAALEHMARASLVFAGQPDHIVRPEPESPGRMRS